MRLHWHISRHKHDTKVCNALVDLGYSRSRMHFFRMSIEKKKNTAVPKNFAVMRFQFWLKTMQ